MAQIDRVLRSNIKLRHLQLVVALDQFRHIGRTADFLSVSQPAVSKMLTEVEGMLGLALFDRSTRGTAPTAAGLSLIRFARSVLAQYERTRDEISAVASGAAGRTRVGCMGGALPVLLSRGVALLKERSARATVLIEEGDLTHLLPKLRINELDFFLGRLEPGYAAPDLVTEALYNEPMVAVVRRGHPLARKTRPAWADLARLPCIVPPPWASLRVKIEQEFHRCGLEPPIDLIESSSYFAIATFAGQLDAVGFMARSVGRHFEREGLFKILALDVGVELPPVGIITMRGQRLTTSTQQLIECLRAAVVELFGPKGNIAAKAERPGRGRKK